MAKKKKSIVEKFVNEYEDDYRKSKGRYGEIAFEEDMAERGTPVERIRVGGDYIRGKKYYEVKTGNSRLTKAQEKMKKKLGKNFVEVRVH